jgi:hypothetical protein
LRPDFSFLLTRTKPTKRDHDKKKRRLQSNLTKPSFPSQPWSLCVLFHHFQSCRLEVASKISDKPQPHRLLTFTGHKTRAPTKSKLALLELSTHFLTRPEAAGLAAELGASDDLLTTSRKTSFLIGLEDGILDDGANPPVNRYTHGPNPHLQMKHCGRDAVEVDTTVRVAIHD